jgi:hypothetical protein
MLAVIVMSLLCSVAAGSQQFVEVPPGFITHGVLYGEVSFPRSGLVDRLDVYYGGNFDRV